jgi:hypothetical protein
MKVVDEGGGGRWLKVDENGRKCVEVDEHG